MIEKHSKLENHSESANSHCVESNHFIRHTDFKVVPEDLSPAERAKRHGGGLTDSFPLPLGLPWRFKSIQVKILPHSHEMGKLQLEGAPAQTYITPIIDILYFLTRH